MTLDPADTAWALCTTDAAPDDAILVESTTAAATHELVVRGLLAATDYSCEVHAGHGGEATASFRSGTVPDLPALEATTTGDGAMSGAYTLFNVQPSCTAEAVWLVIVDPDGHPRWAYRVGDQFEGDIDAALTGPDRVHLGGGWGSQNEASPNRGVFRDIDLSGEVLVERDAPDFGLGFNHHSEALPDGTYLGLTGHHDSDGVDTWYGVGVEQWSPTDGLVWSWDSQALVDAGLVAKDPYNPYPYNANSVKSVTDALGEAVWVSEFGDQALWRIDRATRELTLRFGHGKDFALVDPNGDPLPDSEFPYVQHDPDYQDDRVLVYDNAQGQPDGRGSRVAEYHLDLASQVATLLWSWTEPGWSDPVGGDADYLPNGNVLVTQTYVSCFAYGDDVSEIVEIEPPSTVVWRMPLPDEGWMVYRSERYDGCAAFSNARYCPAVADRVAELSAGR
ncbi:MAG: aryl-sulfate sulfotransferase [Myxococcota bacterium]